MPIKIEAALEATLESVYYGNIVQTTDNRDQITFPELKRQKKFLNQAAEV